MKLLDMLTKSKKPAARNTLGSMWVCVVKCMPWKKDWYDVLIKEVSVIEAAATGSGSYVKTDEGNPFNKYDPAALCGHVDELNYDQEKCYWVGFFETEEKAKAAYRDLAKKLISCIEAKSLDAGGLTFSGEN